MLTEELIQQFHKFSEKGKAYDCIDARIATLNLSDHLMLKRIKERAKAQKV